MELNAEQIKRDLEICTTTGDCPKCHYNDCTSLCINRIMMDALALINELTAENKLLNVELGNANSEILRLIERTKELTEENEYLKSTDIGDLQQEYDSLAKSLEDAIELIDKIRAKKAKLSEENERLRLEYAAVRVGTEYFKCENDKHIKLLDDKCDRCIIRERADTVREMHSEIKERCIKGGIYPAFVASTIDQIAKEMLDGQDGTR